MTGRPIPEESGTGGRGWLAWAAVVTALVAALVVGALAAGRPERTRAVVKFVHDSLDQLRAAADAFWANLTSIGWGALGIALVLSLSNLLLRASGWRSVIAAAYPDARVRWRSVAGASAAGVGVNAILPARLGEPVKLFLIRRRVDGATYPTLAASLVADTVFDVVVGLGLLVWAWQLGVLPGVPQLPNLPLFELAWYARHPWILLIVAAVIVAAILFAASRLRDFWRRVGQGLTILTTPSRYLRSVAPQQALAWCCRVAAAYFFLQAFHVEATLRNALLVQVASQLATLAPATPGGLGPRQALLVVLLTDAGTTTEILAFSFGMEIALTVWNAGVGLVCLGGMLGHLRLREALRAARAERSRASRQSETRP